MITSSRLVVTALVGVLGLGALTTNAHAAGERRFLSKALQGDNSEMALGQMAATQGASPGTRDFGRMLHDDHAAAKQKALPVAQAHGVPDTDAMAPEARAEQRRLERMHGRAFDREFARYMVGDHRKDIADFERAAHASDPPTAALARDTLPDLRKHLHTAQDLLASR